MVVEMRFFGGLSADETAEVPDTANRVAGLETGASVADARDGQVEHLG
jgi:hypothetical protein